MELGRVRTSSYNRLVAKLRCNRSRVFVGMRMRTTIIQNVIRLINKVKVKIAVNVGRVGGESFQS